MFLKVELHMPAALPTAVILHVPSRFPSVQWLPLSLGPTYFLATTVGVLKAANARKCFPLSGTAEECRAFG
jgi:hypothetical protein